MAFPIIRDPKVIHLFVDKFKYLLDGWGDTDIPFYNFCEKNLINEITLDDTWLLSSNINYYTYEDLITRGRSEHYIYEFGTIVNIYEPTTYGQEQLNYVINYNNFQIDPIKKIDRITLKNNFWELETSLNPLKNSSGYLITTNAGSATATVIGGSLLSLFTVGNMVKVISTGEYRQVLSIGVGTVTFDRPFDYSTVPNPSTFEVRDNIINSGYTIDFDTFAYRLKSIRNLADTNNLKVDGYLPRNLTQTQLLKIVHYFDKIFIENDYDQYNYTLYNDGTQLDNVRTVLLRGTQNRSGTVFIGNNSDILYGTGTDFANELRVGGSIVINGVVYKILNITNSTVAQLDQINSGNTITNADYNTYVEFLPIFHLDKTLRQNWMITPLSGKSYDDVFKLFTLSGFTVSGNVQPTSPTPICYNLETNPSITGSTNLLGISVYGSYDAQIIDPNVKKSSLLRTNATNSVARLIPINTTFAVSVTGTDCTCDNAVNGSVEVNLNTNVNSPYDFIFTNGNRTITVNDQNSPFTFNGLGVGTWTINVTDSTGANAGSSSVIINESFLPTLNGVNIGGVGNITGTLIGGYQNYFIATLAAGTFNYDNVYFNSNLTDGPYTYGTFTLGATYDFIIGDTDACIKLFRGIRIPTTSTGIILALSSVNPACSSVNNGSITATVSGQGTAPYTFTFTPSVGAPSIGSSNSTSFTLNNAGASTWTVSVTDSSNPPFTTQNTVTLTNNFNPQLGTITFNSVCFNLQSQYAPYTIVSNSGPTQVNTIYNGGGTYCLNNLVGGTYSFTITAQNGCSQLFTNIVVPTRVLTLNVQNFTYASCEEVSNGIVNLTTLGGANTPPLSYSATNGTIIYTNTTGQFNNLSSGIWTFIVSQGIVTAPSVIQNLVPTSFGVFTSSTGGTICISASGGSTGFYTVDINGTLYPYNTLLSPNCYTATCRDNRVRVIDGDIINTSISGCVYTQIINGNCGFDFNFTGNSVTCGDYGSIFARAFGGEPPYLYTITDGVVTYNNLLGNFPVLNPGTWELTVIDTIGNSGTTILDLDNRVRFIASSGITGTCVTIMDGLPPYYILIDDIIYTAQTGGTYCFEIETCGYHGVNVYDSCPNNTCVNYLFTRTELDPGVVPYQVRYFDCYGMIQDLILPQFTGATGTTCLILGSPLLIHPNITGQLIGFCATSISANCYDDRSQLINIKCTLPLGIQERYKPIGPSCPNRNDGQISVKGFDGVTPYISYSATNGTELFTNSNGFFNFLSVGEWTLYVSDSVGAITSMTYTLEPLINDNVNTSFLINGINNIEMCVEISSTQLPVNFTEPYEINIEGNQFFVPTTDTIYCFILSGITSCGVIDYTICSNNQSFSLIYSFRGGLLGERPYGSLLLASNGILYGMTKLDSMGNGLIFSCTTNGNYGVIGKFDGINGYLPSSNSLIQGIDGNLYGMTTEGGNYSDGNIFKCTLQGVITSIYDFGTVNNDGRFPTGDLVEYGIGKFYGLTSEGGNAPGATFGGTIFSCNTLGNCEILFEFGQGNTGERPYGSPLLASNGRLYGTTLEGGQSQNGVIFNFNPANRTLTNTTFNTGINGTNPTGTLIEASDDYLYCTLSLGGDYTYGTIVKYGPVSTIGNTLTTVHHFGLGQDGRSPSNNSKLFESNGILYGTTPLGGTYNNGIIFSYNLTTSEYKILYSFGIEAYPGQGFLLEPISGYLYGMTYDGGAFNKGTIYAFNITASTESCCYENSIDLNEVLMPVPNFIYGDVLNGDSLVCISLDTDNDNFISYGINVNGTNYVYNRNENVNCFVSTPYSASVNVTVCKNFDNYNLNIIYDVVDNFSLPINPTTIIMASNGLIYGTSAGSGSAGNGAIFSCDTLGNFGEIHAFTINTGIIPVGNLLEVSDGLFYGMTQSDITGNGLIYSCNTLGNYGVIQVFNSTLGTTPYGSLILGSDNYLYGTTSLGGTNLSGTIFKINLTGTISFVLHEFPDPLISDDGANPRSTLLEGSDGFFYGITNAGGLNGTGIIFKINFDGSIYNKIYDFSSVEIPGTFLIESAGGILYGVTTESSYSSSGAIFSCNTSGNYGEIFYFPIITPSGTFQNPINGLYEGVNGQLYGTLYGSGPSLIGAIFTVNNLGNASIIYDFESGLGLDGSGVLYTNLFLGLNGNIYGATINGGFDDVGVIFEITNSQNSGCCYTTTVQIPQCLSGVTFSTNWTNNMPYVCVTIDQTLTSGPYEVIIDGVIYDFNLGTIFGTNYTQLTNCYPITGNCGNINVTVCEKEITQLLGYTLEYTFSGFTYGDGKNPYGDLMLNYDGIFYGMTKEGGNVSIPITAPNGCGTIFKFDPITKNYQIIHNFDGTNGMFPLGTLQSSTNNVLYGVTSSDSVNFYGVLFSCRTDGSDFNIFYNFNVNPLGHGTNPITLPTKDPYYNKFYRGGTTIGGGLNGGGTSYLYDDGVYINHYEFPGYFHVGLSPYFLNGLTPPFINVPSSGREARGPQLYVEYSLSILYNPATPAFFGMAREGGQYGFGTIYYNDPYAYGVYDIYNFAGGTTNGKFPSGGLVLTYTNNKVYGMTEQGGTNPVPSLGGIIFSVDFTNINSPTLDVIHSFLGGANDGGSPLGSLLYNNDYFYGMTRFGGDANEGVIFRFDPNEPPPYDYSVLHDFGGSKGAYPHGSLTMGPDGKLYGMTTYGGNGDGYNGNGVIFSIDDNLKLRNKCCYTTYLTIENDVQLPQITTVGVDTVCVTIDSDNYYQPPYLINLDGIIISAITSGGISQTCFSGLSCGFHTITIDSYYTQSGFYTEIDYVNFGGGKGYKPLGSLFQTSNGSFYAMANFDTTNNRGLVFSCGTNGGYSELGTDWLFGTIGGTRDSSSPTGNFIEPTPGILFAMTPLGGTSNIGTIFEINLSTGARSVLYEFDYPSTPDGATNPYGSFFKASDGLLYGLSSGGGVYNKGTIFTYDYLNIPAPPITVYSFTNISSRPYGSLIEPTTGYLFGTFSEDNSVNLGGIFSYEIGTANYFYYIFTNSTEGVSPKGSLISVPTIPDRLFGMTTTGGNGYGNIFSIDYTANIGNVNFNNLQNIHIFDGITGSNPKGDLLLSSDGYFYGMTFEGGFYNNGVIFKIYPDGTNYRVIFNFNGIANQYNPVSNLIQGVDGLLYGMTPGDEITFIPGTIFKLDLTNTYDYCQTNLSSSIPCLIVNTLSAITSCTNSGLVVVEAIGASPPFMFTITNTNGITTYSGSTMIQGQDIIFSGLSSGIWALNVYDNFNNYYTQTYNLSPFPNREITVIDSNICISDETNSLIISILINGEIRFQGTFPDEICLSANCGTNVVTLSGSNGCYETINVDIPCPPLTLVSIDITNPFCCDGKASVIVNVDGIGDPYTYTIHNVPNTASYTNNTGIFNNVTPPTGYWLLTVTDANGTMINSAFTLTSYYFADILFGSSDVTIIFSGGNSTLITINGSAFTYNTSSGVVTFPLNCGVNNTVTVVGYDNGSTGATAPFACDVIFISNDGEFGDAYVFNPNPATYPVTPINISTSAHRNGAIYSTRGFDKIYFPDIVFPTNQYVIGTYDLSTTPIGTYNLLYTIPLPTTIKGIALKEENATTGDEFFVANTTTGSIDVFNFLNPNAPTITTLFTLPLPYQFSTTPFDGFDRIYYDGINQTLHMTFTTPSEFVIFDLFGNIIRAGSPPGLSRAKNSFIYNNQIYVVDENGGLWLTIPDPNTSTGLIFTSVPNFMNFPYPTFGSILYGFIQYNNGVCYNEICVYSGSTYPICPLECDVTVVQPRCEGQEAESVTVLINGGTPEYNITLTNGILTYSANTTSNSYTFVNDPNVDLPIGTWTLSVVDFYGDICINDNVVIEPTFNARFTATTNGLCFEVSGGTEPYILVIDGVRQLPPGYIYLNNQIYCITLSCGTHTILIEETAPLPNDPCVATINYVRPCLLLGSVYTTNPGCNGNCNGTITIFVTGNSPYNYTITNVDTNTSLQWGPTILNSYTFTNLCPGEYDISVIAADGSIYTNTGVTLDYVYDVMVTSYSDPSSCNLGSMCVGITGGTPPYDIYIDGVIVLSATNLTDVCFTATCGVNHTYEVYDSSPPCNIPANVPLFNNPSFTGETDWFHYGSVYPFTTCNDYSGDTFISNGLFTYTSTTTGISTQNCTEYFVLFQLGNYSYPLPFSATYTLEMSSATLNNCVSVQTLIGTPFGVLNVPNGAINTSTLATTNNNYYLVNNLTIPTTIFPTSITYTGFNLSFVLSVDHQIGNPNVQFQLDYIQLILQSYVIDCSCSASGTTYVPCNPPLDLSLISFVPPDCNGACNGEIIVSASGGVVTYTYTATNGTIVIVNNTGEFIDLCEGEWDIFVSDGCGNVLDLGSTFILNSTFEVDIVSYPTRFCVTISGGTAPFHIFIDNFEIATVTNPGTYCYDAECGVTTIIRVTDSSDSSGP